MFQLIRKGLVLAAIYILLQLLLMAFSWLLFDINLFETSKSVRVMMDLSRNELKWMIALNQFFGLLLPAILFLIFFYKEKAGRHVQIQIPENSTLILISLGIWLVSMPAIQFLTIWNESLPLADWMNDTSDEITHYMREIIFMDSPTDLIVNLALIALLPSLAEELFFRGVVQKEFEIHLGNPHLAVLLTAMFFSAIHFQFEGFLPRFFLGAILGYTYFYSRSLFIPILIHFTNNALMVVLAYQNEEVLNNEMTGDVQVQYPLLLISLVLLIYLFYRLRKISAHEME
jgi:membrane protease YdiL (CAAX protease family)